MFFTAPVAWCHIFISFHRQSISTPHLNGDDVERNWIWRYRGVYLFVIPTVLFRAISMGWGAVSRCGNVVTYGTTVTAEKKSSYLLCFRLLIIFVGMRHNAEEISLNMTILLSVYE